VLHTTVQVYEGGVMQAARLKPVDELEALFRGAGVDVQAPLVCSCGSGLTACVLALALHQVRVCYTEYSAMLIEQLAVLFPSQQLYETAGRAY
jgi:3-mercaptopyruvate sulfurtransferase SseA